MREDKKYSINYATRPIGKIRKVGKEIIIEMPHPNKVEKAFSIHWEWLHEVQFELAENAHPSWKDYTKNQFNRIREIKETMSDEERKEFDNKIKPYKVLHLKKG